ncbi:MAG: DUF4176 domain-containing protein [Clostridium sp.]|nr:DUF4176 domain-containing protein [Clostridium sp.]
MEGINKKQLVIDLLKRFTSNLNYLEEDDKKSINKLGVNLYGGDLKQLYEINECLVNGTEDYKDRLVSYKKENDKYKLIIKDYILELSFEEIKEIVIGLIDILDDILPLGTVVKLKKEYIHKFLNNNEIEEAEVVIVNRFIFKNEINAYFPYAGVIYPLGFVGSSNAIQFSSALIDDVIHRGYSDEKDDVYTFLLKNELIIDKKMHSFGFASEEERNKYNELIKGEQHD